MPVTGFQMIPATLLHEGLCMTTASVISVDTPEPERGSKTITTVYKSNFWVGCYVTTRNCYSIP